MQKTQNQLELVKKQLDAAGQIFRIDSNLYVQKVLSNAEFQHSKNTYLQHLQSFENAKLSIDHQNMSILQSVTNYGKTLEFSQEMTGSAEIITEDLRLLDKFLNPIKAVIKK